MRTRRFWLKVSWMELTASGFRPPKSHSISCWLFDLRLVFYALRAPNIGVLTKSAFPVPWKFDDGYFPTSIKQFRQCRRQRWGMVRKLFFNRTYIINVSEVKGIFQDEIRNAFDKFEVEYEYSSYSWTYDDDCACNILHHFTVITEQENALLFKIICSICRCKRLACADNF